MKYSVLGFATLLCVALGVGEAPAQFSAGFDLEFTTLLQGEPVRARITLTNDTVDSVVVGRNVEGGQRVDMEFRITRKDEDSPRRLASEPLVAGLELDPGEGMTFDTDLTSLYDLFPAGQYRVSLIWTADGRTMEAAARIVEIVGGIELKRVKREVPGAGPRSYSLRYWSRNNRESLFLRAESADGRVQYGVFELGELVRVYEPTLSIDRHGTLVVTHQVGAEQFRRTEFKSTARGVQFIKWSDMGESGEPFEPGDGDGDKR